MGLEERQANWLGYSGCKSRGMKLKPSAYLRETVRGHPRGWS